MRVSHVTVRKRLLIVLAVGVLIFLTIGIRLGYVQFFLGDMLTKRAQDSWSRNVWFEPKRGEILDRNGKVLATNKSAPTVFVVPRQIENPETTAQQLATILKMKKEKVLYHLTNRVAIERINPEGRKISHDVAKQIRALNLKGVYIAEDTKRYYPKGSYLSHVLGFAGIDNQGLNGLELYYDEQLKGEKGYVRFFADAKGQRMPNIGDQYIPPTDGLNLKLTIDDKVQAIIERELDNAQAQYNPDAIIAIAMNPKNGQILAMSSRPDYDPTKYKTTDPIIYNRNLPVWSTYEPGSTFKIITLASALNENLVDLEGDHFFDGGAAEVAGARLRCWKREGHGSQTFLEVVQNSCNPGFIELGNRLGKKRLFDYIDKFGFGDKTGIDLQGEATGILFKPEKAGPVEQATTAFGQGVSVTPIQQITAVSAAVNGGILYQPYLAKEFIDPKTKEAVSQKEPIEKRKVISEEASKKVRYALENVVAKGSGRSAFVDGYRVGGKTGTAQKVKNGVYMTDSYVVSFIGVAPMDDPEIAIYLAIDHPKGTIQFGGVVAAPIVGNMMREILPAMGVKPRKNQIEKKLVYPEEPLVEVPNLVGMTTKELQEQLESLQLDVSGTGKKVIAQSPKAGTKLKSNSKIRIYLGNE
ncbi:MAG: stage V sporulation protein D [Bacillaceae bacterium]